MNQKSAELWSLQMPVRIISTPTRRQQYGHKGDKKEFTDPDNTMAHIKMHIIPVSYIYQV